MNARNTKDSLKVDILFKILDIVPQKFLLICLQRYTNKSPVLTKERFCTHAILLSVICSRSNARPISPTNYARSVVHDVLLQ